LHKTQEVGGVVLPTDQQASFPLHPGEEPHDEPAALVPPQVAPVLEFQFSGGPVWGDQRQQAGQADGSCELCYNETTPVKTFAFRTVVGAVALDYSLTQSTTQSLSQEYTYYERTGVLPHDRIVTMLTLKTEWE
jgi:hypothetical protein